MSLISRGFQAYDGNHAPPWVKDGNFRMNRVSGQARNMLAWYPMSDAGPPSDHSGFGHHFDFGVGGGNEILTNPSRFGHRVKEFQFGDYYDNTSFVLDTSLPWSVSFWYRLDGYGDVFPCVLQMRTDQVPFMFIFNTSSSSYEPFSFGAASVFIGSGKIDDVLHPFQDSDLGQTHHITVTYNGGTRSTLTDYSCYRDGLVQTLEAGGSYGGLVDENRIGLGNGAGGGTRMDGQVWDIRIRQLEVTPQEAFLLWHPSSLWDLYQEDAPRRSFFAPAIDLWPVMTIGKTLNLISPLFVVIFLKKNNMD